MKVRALWLVLLLALALAHPLRVRAGAANVVAPGELYGVAALFADGESHVHARRVECALEGAGIEGRDGLLGHPQPAELVCAPLWDAARTSLVELRVPREDDLGRQRFLAGLGPWIGALAVFLVWLAAGAAGAGAWERALAAAWVALAPACVQGDAWGRLSDVGCTLLVVLLAARATLRTLRAEDPLRAVLGGIASGAFAGVPLACSPAGLAPFLAGVLAFVQWTFTAEGETRRFAARAGLLHSLVAALVARMLVLDGPWQTATGGVFATWVELAALLAFASCVPFLAAMLREHLGARRFVPALVMLAGAVAVVLLLVRSGAEARRVWTAWLQARELRPLFAASSATASFLALTPLVLLVPLGWIGCLRGARDACGTYLAALSLGTLVATLVDPALAPWCVAASALCLARAATSWEPGTRARRGAGLAVGAVLAAHAAAGFLAQPDAALHETRVEIARGLRWMREHTPSPGPWNAPRAQPDWGVLSVPSRGAEIAWHARRAAVFSEAGAYGPIDSLLTGSQALRGDEFERSMHACGARYIAVSPLDEQDFESLIRMPKGLGGENRPLAGYQYPFHSFVLPSPDAKDGSGPICVYRSPRIVDVHGHAEPGDGLHGPAISIWELPPPAKSKDSGPQMRPR